MKDLIGSLKQRIAERVIHEPLGFVRLFRAAPEDTYLRSVLVPDDTMIFAKEGDRFWQGHGVLFAFPENTDAAAMAMLAGLAVKAEPGNISSLFRYCVIVADEFGDVLPDIVSFLVSHDVEVLLYSYLSMSPDSLAFKHGRYLSNLSREMEYIQGKGIVYGEYMPEYPGPGATAPLLPLPPCSACGRTDTEGEYHIHYDAEHVKGVVLCEGCHIGEQGLHRSSVY